MTDRDAVLERVDIATIATLAGFKKNRGNAWFCGFHENRRTPAASVHGRRIYCWGACQQNWDAFGLVMQWQGLDFRGALQWLADYCSITLNSRPPTNRELRNYALRRAVAEQEARELVEWRDRMIEALLDARNAHLGAYHRGLRYI